MDYLPIFLDVRRRPVLVVGAGSVAARKADLLLRAGAELAVVAPDIGPAMAELARAGRVRLLHRRFEPADLNGVAAAIAATNDPATNQAVFAAARGAGIPVNVVDQPAISTFIFPAIIDRSPLIVAVSSGGASPVLARLMRARLESLIPAGYGRLAGLARRFRSVVQARIADPVARRRFWESVFEGPVADAVLANRDAAAQSRLETMLDEAAKAPSTGAPLTRGEVYLVGAGPGDPDLLTFRALRLMQKADVVLHDRLIPAPLLDLVRRDADRIDVGKQRGNHTMSQQDIGRLMVRLAGEGRRVLRLKGGDPFMFGHGGEEADVLAANGVMFQVVPGITAATGCAAYAGIPLTHRDYAQCCVFITGHLADERKDLDWAMLALPRQTLVIYMGLGNAAAIARELIAQGAEPGRPVAIVVDGTRPSQSVIVATLADLPAAAARVTDRTTALIIIGDVVRLARPPS